MAFTGPTLEPKYAERLTHLRTPQLGNAYLGLSYCQEKATAQRNQRLEVHAPHYR